MRSALGRALEEELVAQSVFQRCLLPYLSERGAMPLEKLESSGLELFHLKLSSQEIGDVLELARRQGLVEPLGHGSDAFGEQVGSCEWAATERGRKLKRPTGLTLKDMREYLVQVTPLGTKLAGAVQGLFAVLPVAALLGVSSGDSGKKLLVAGAVAVVCLVLMLYLGFRGDGKLRRAALAWKRFEETWPISYGWQVNRLRPWLGVLAGALYVSIFVADSLTTLPELLGIGIGAVAIAIVGGLYGASQNGPVEREQKPDPGLGPDAAEEAVGGA